MGGPLDDDAPPTVQDVEAVIGDGMHSGPEDALAELGAVLSIFDRRGVDHPDDAALLLALYGRAHLLRLLDSAHAETIDACDTLEQVAGQRGHRVWEATARALRAAARLDRGEGELAIGDLARVDVDALDDQLDCTAGYRLLDAAAAAFGRLRLYDRLDETRARLEAMVAERPPLDQASHWTRWSIELACRAMEPVARGAPEPDGRLLDQAAEIAGRVARLGPADVPQPLDEGARIVRGLAAAWRGDAAQALALLELRTPARLRRASGAQLAVLALMRAQLEAGAPQEVVALDDRAPRGAALSLANLVLEVARVRERLVAEHAIGGDPAPVVQRLTDLLVRLGWHGMSLVAETARHAVEHQALRTESRTDPLTGVGNRRALDEDLRHLLRFTPLPLSLVLVDVDHFKAVNDEHTHLIGDEVLRRVADALAGCLRPGDRVVRYGGDEFVVLLPDTDADQAAMLATRLTAAVEQGSWADVATRLRVQVTTGSATVHTLTGRRPDADAEQLFRRADEALLEAKRRNRAEARPLPRPLPPPLARPLPVGSALPEPTEIDLRDGVRAPTRRPRVIDLTGRMPALPPSPEPPVADPGADQVVTEPVITEPVITEPVITEPVTTEPVTTEPVTTEPRGDGSAGRSHASWWREHP